MIFCVWADLQQLPSRHLLGKSATIVQLFPSRRLSSSMGWKITHSFILKEEEWDTFCKTVCSLYNLKLVASFRYKLWRTKKLFKDKTKSYLDALHVSGTPPRLLVSPRRSPPLPVTPDTPYITRECGQVPSDHQLMLVTTPLCIYLCISLFILHML